MYKLGVKPHHRRKLLVVFIVLALLVLGGLGLAAKNFFKSNTTIQDSAAHVHYVGVVTPAVKTVTTATFSMKIPKDWKATTGHDLIPRPEFSWQGTAKGDTARGLDVYVDAIPSQMGVNRLLPVRGSGNRIVLTDNVSDNCINFTDASKVNHHTGIVSAKWSGVNFNCDAANYERDVVGTGSSGAINSVTVKGSDKGTHRYFLLYTDNSAEADYSYFTDILSSFRAL